MLTVWLNCIAKFGASNPDSAGTRSFRVYLQTELNTHEPANQGIQDY